MRTGANPTGCTGVADRAFLPTRATQRWTRTSCSPWRRANAAGVSPLARSAATISSPSASCHRARPRGGVHSAGAVTTRGPLLRSVVISAISASWLATLTETRERYQTSTTGRLRRLTGSAAGDTGQSFTYGYTDVLLSSVTAPGGPAPGIWKTGIDADVQGRPSRISRFTDASNRETYGYAYASQWNALPTSLTRGYNGSSTAVTTFAYDDFGRLLEATTPEVGRPTRYEYDVGDRLVRRRDGVGAAEVNTTAYSYDALGRTTRIAHDLEHAVNCAGGGPAGTPIQDEEYTYDGCAAADRPDGVACSNALGQRTISRAIEQCGTAGDVIKRGRWYDYDVLGRVPEGSPRS